jgi:hypothetical protein
VCEPNADKDEGVLLVLREAGGVVVIVVVVVVVVVEKGPPNVEDGGKLIVDEGVGEGAGDCVLPNKPVGARGEAAVKGAAVAAAENVDEDSNVAVMRLRVADAEVRLARRGEAPRIGPPPGVSSSSTDSRSTADAAFVDDGDDDGDDNPREGEADGDS